MNACPIWRSVIIDVAADIYRITKRTKVNGSHQLPKTNAIATQIEPHSFSAHFDKRTADAPGTSLPAVLSELERFDPPLVRFEVDAVIGKRIWIATAAGADAVDADPA